MSDGSEKKSSGGLKGILLVVGLGVAFLIQKFTGVDIMSMLNKDKDSKNQTVVEQPADTPRGELQIPDGNKNSAKSPETKKPAPAVKKTPPANQTAPAKGDDGVAFVRQQFKAMKSKVWVKTQGEVEHILKDDNYGDRHQQFLLKLAPDLIVKVAHNIDDAPYVTGLKKGDFIKLQGRYEYSEKGGTIHFTHKADRPTKNKPGGWIEYNGKIYK